MGGRDRRIPRSSGQLTWQTEQGITTNSFPNKAADEDQHLVLCPSLLKGEVRHDFFGHVLDSVGMQGFPPSNMTECAMLNIFLEIKEED